MSFFAESCVGRAPLLLESVLSGFANSCKSSCPTASSLCGSDRLQLTEILGVDIECFSEFEATSTGVVGSREQLNLASTIETWSVRIGKSAHSLADCVPGDGEAVLVNDASLDHGLEGTKRLKMFLKLKSDVSWTILALGGVDGAARPQDSGFACVLSFNAAVSQALFSSKHVSLFMAAVPEVVPA
jgi:hypothetical protein